LQRIPSLARCAGFAYSKYVLLTLVLALSACAGSRGPAPIVKRTGDPVRPADAPREPNLTPTPAPTVPPPTDSSGVQTAPVRPSGIESRPLDARAATPGQPATPAGPAGAAGSTGPTGSAVGCLGSLRTGPKGLKRPFSDTALAEMKALEPLPPVAKLDPLGTVPATPANPANPANPAATAGAGKPAEAEKSVPTGALDLAWPLRGKVVQAFAEPKQVGIIVDGKLGDPVAAAADGKVIFSGPGPRGYGNLLIVKHDAETVTVYAHNKTLLAKEGQSVKRGQKIAEVGDTGSDRVGLHFEVRKQGKPVDPQKLLPKR
jgi:lipoprotein NlpD